MNFKMVMTMSRVLSVAEAEYEKAKADGNVTYRELAELIFKAAVVGLEGFGVADEKVV